MKLPSNGLAVLVGLVVALPSIGRTEPPPADALRAGAKDDLTILVQTARSAWAYADDKREHFGVDLDQLSASAVTRFQGCHDLTEVFEVLREVVAGLKDGHASVRWSPPTPAPPRGCIRGRFCDTREGVVFEKQLIVQWNGADVQDELRRLARQVYASTPGMARQLALEKLPAGPLHQTVRVKLRIPSGAEEEKLLRFEPETGAELPPLELRWPEKGIAHLAIRSFDVRRSGWGVKTDGPVNASGLPTTAVQEVQQKISDAFKSCANAQALILDLRGNLGGTDSVGSHVALHLLPGEFTYFKLQTRYSPELKKLEAFKSSPERGWSEPGDGWKPPRPPALKPFTGPVWVLLDELCFSTTDNLLACLRDLLPKERARFLGRPSGGGTGAPRSLVTLPFTGAQLTLTVMKVYSPKGKLIEGRGTVPDREIAWTWKDVIHDHDPDLIAALAEARARLNSAPSTGTQP